MSGYPKINVMDPSSQRTWLGNNKFWYIQEKIDGSQISFVLSPDRSSLLFYNKSTLLKMGNSVFRKTITLLHEMKDVFSSEFRYHGEAVSSIRHNVIQYQRVPRFYFVLYDLQEESTKRYLSLEEVEEEGKRTNLETVATLYRNTDETVSPYVMCKTLLTAIEKGEIKSMLGGDVEGVVLKHHAYVDSKGKKVSTKLKLVTEKFQERHAERKPPAEKLKPDSFLIFLGSQFSTEARYHKAVQHLRERGVLTGDLPTDTTLLVEELDKDLQEEHTSLLKNYLWVEFSPIVKNCAREGFSQWYKATFGIDRKKSITPELPEKETEEPKKETEEPEKETKEPKKETKEPKKETNINLPEVPKKETDTNFSVTVPSQKKSVEEFLLKLGSNYATEERFMKVVERVKVEKPKKEKPDIGAMIMELGSDCDDDKEELKEVFWRECRAVVLERARFGFEEWYKSHFGMEKWV